MPVSLLYGKISAAVSLFKKKKKDKKCILFLFNDTYVHMHILVQTHLLVNKDWTTLEAFFPLPLASPDCFL